ncbi:MAG: hypothetical protein WDO15_29610 [Bacteroidota bacterium]
MKKFKQLLFVLTLFAWNVTVAQNFPRETPKAPKDSIVDAIIKEATESSQLEKLGHEIIGRRRAAIDRFA